MSDISELMLQQMMSGYQPSANELNSLFADHADPRVRMIAQFMSQQADDLDDETVIEQASIIEEASTSSSESMRLRRKLRELNDELHEAQSIGDTLAAALGACYLCWGEDTHCEHCAGEGTPGWSMPDEELFSAYVAPAVERLHKVSRKGDSTGTHERPHRTEPHAGGLTKGVNHGHV